VTTKIIPKPKKTEIKNGNFKINPFTVLVAENSLDNEINYLLKILGSSTGYKLCIKNDRKNIKNSILLELVEGFLEEGYHLNIERENICIRASTKKGVFYGIQSLLQLLPEEIYSKKVIANFEWTIPCVLIDDSPRFEWRGMHLDCCRHFFDVNFIKKFLDLLAHHKMNIFHWHLTEDQGWRIEIKKYPKLTVSGAYRRESSNGYNKKGFDGIPYGGFYSRKEIMGIVRYAEKLHISILPEIEMPGHAQAAIASYPELGNVDEPLEVWTSFGVSKNIFNPDEKTILFLQDVLKEVMELFPFKYIHIGGDEVVKDQWLSSESVKLRMKDLGLKNTGEMQSYFIKRMEEFLKKNGRILIGWDEIQEGDLSSNAVVMAWRNREKAVSAAKLGYRVICTPEEYTYFNHCQMKDGFEKETLLYDKYIPLSKVYNYEPLHKTLTEKEKKQFIGGQGQLWSEYISNVSELEQKAFPRLTAMAEVLWTAKGEKNFEDFSSRLQTHFRRLDFLNVKYRKVFK